MKNIIIALCLITNYAFTQPIRIELINPGSICPGDTLNVYFKWDNSPGSTNFILLCSSANQIWNYNNDSFYSLPKTLVGGDTLYEVKLFTYSFWTLGISTLSTDFVNTTPIYFNFCDTTGIPTQNLSEEAKTYLDFYGNTVKPQRGELLIEQQGRTRKKVFIIDN